MAPRGHCLFFGSILKSSARQSSLKGNPRWTYLCYSHPTFSNLVSKKVAFHQFPNCSWKKQRKSHFVARERTCHNVFNITSSFLRESGCTNSYIMTIIVESSDENEARQKMIMLHLLDCNVEEKKSSDFYHHLLMFSFVRPSCKFINIVWMPNCQLDRHACKTD